MKALLIIDMQQGSFTAETPRYDTDGVVERINRLGDIWRRQGDPVIFIQHDGSQHGDFIPGTDSWKLLPGLEQREGDLYVAKTANDCFYHSELAAQLAAAGIKDIVITGCATDFCVDTTVKAALGLDFRITVLSDAHTTADRPGISAAQVIGHYNWVWQHMLPTGGSLRVMSCAAYEQAISV